MMTYLRWRWLELAKMASKHAEQFEVPPEFYWWRRVTALMVGVLLFSAVSVICLLVLVIT